MKFQFNLKPFMGILILLVFLAGCAKSNPDSIFSPQEDTVRNIYRSVAGGEPSRENLDHYVKELQGGKSEAEIAAEIHNDQLQSQNNDLAQLRTQQPEKVAAAESAYRDILKREATAPEVHTYVDALIAGKTDADLRANLKNSDEFRNISGSSDTKAVVTRVYRDMLQRDPDPSGLTTWTAFLQKGNTEQALRTTISHSKEFMEKHPSGVVSLSNLNAPLKTDTDRRAAIKRVYNDLLLREPDPTGAMRWNNWLAKGRTEADMRQGVMLSDEYKARHK